MPRRFIRTAALALATLSAAVYTFDIVGLATASTSVKKTVLETFAKPWAMTFLPDGRALVTEKGGKLWLVGTNGKKLGEITGVPSVKARGQGGLGDVILHPDFATNGVIYLSFVERDADDSSLSGAAVFRARMSLNEASGSLSGGDIIWRQVPKVTGSGHYGYRMAHAGARYVHQPRKGRSLDRYRRYSSRQSICRARRRRRRSLEPWSSQSAWDRFCKRRSALVA